MGQADASAAAANDTISSTTSANTTADAAAAAGTRINAAAITNAAGQVTAGATKIVGWTFENMNILETSTSKSGLRPMHVRVSIRVHHVAFLHPGLDNGGRSRTGSGRFGKWKFAKKSKVTPPGLLRFGSKKGDWKNPKYHPHIPSAFGGSSHLGMDDQRGINSSRSNTITTKPWRDDEIDDISKDTTEIAEIISAEAFRLSRDGIIQNHYALHHASSQPSFPPRGRLPGNKHYHHPQSNTQDEARYYKECAERPKGYRRLVVSSACTAGDLTAPPDPNLASSKGGVVPLSAESSNMLSWNSPSSSSAAHHYLEKHASSSSDHSLAVEKDGIDMKKDEKNETMFDNVEYQYVSCANFIFVWSSVRLITL